MGKGNKRAASKAASRPPNLSDGGGAGPSSQQPQAGQSLALLRELLREDNAGGQAASMTAMLLEQVP